jgi:hypothetical protein
MYPKRGDGFMKAVPYIFQRSETKEPSPCFLVSTVFFYPVLTSCEINTNIKGTAEQMILPGPTLGFAFLF